MQKTKIIEQQNQILSELQIDFSDRLKVFQTKHFLRLTYHGYNLLKDSKSFKVVKIDTKTFSITDLTKISKLINDLFYIDQKSKSIYTLDYSFVNFSNLVENKLESIRLSY